MVWLNFFWVDTIALWVDKIRQAKADSLRHLYLTEAISRSVSREAYLSEAYLTKCILQSLS